MNDTKLAILGAGNMGQAILAGALRAGIQAQNVTVTTQDESAKPFLKSKFGVTVANSNAEAVTGADLVIVSVKPYQVSEVLGEISAAVAPETVILSVAVGLDLASLSAALPSGQPIIRAMPNTPAMVGRGVTALSPGSGVTDAQLQLASDVLAGSGDVIVVPENINLPWEQFLVPGQRMWPTLWML